VRPNFSEVENIITELFSLGWGHSLLVGRGYISRGNQNNQAAYDIDGPAWEFAAFDTLEQALNAVIRICSRKLTSFVIGQRLNVRRSSVFHFVSILHRP
jgi:hypothetical protein